MTLDTSLAALAAKLAKTALDDNTLANDRLEIFKLLTMYHLGVSKIAAKKPNDDNDGDDFASFRNRVAASTSGAGKDPLA